MGQTERLPGVVRPENGMVRASTNLTPTGTSALNPVSSVLSPILGTSRMQQKRIPEVVAIKNTRKNDDIRRLIIAKISVILIMSHYLNQLYMFAILIVYFHLK